MFFNSHIFIFIFFPITLVGYFTLARFKSLQLPWGWLLFVSFLFYTYANFFLLPQFPATPQYILLLILSIFGNYQIGQLIAKSSPPSPRAKTWLWLGIILNILVLGYYKYSNFLVSTFSSSWRLEQLILPLGISFYTFNQIAYLVDTYKGEVKTRSQDFLLYSVFVSFFTYITSGPIVRYQEIAPQFTKVRNFIFREKNFALGLVWFCLGLGKKVLIADNLAPGVSQAFSNANQLSLLEAWAGALSYTLQLYFDFSGYSDMAVGLGLLLNIKLPINFNSPYKAISISDFWRRWHISLSNFLRDYLYIPLGGSRRGEARRYVNLLLTMLLGGLWHGAGWTFILWGALHGTYLCINHAWRQLKINLPSNLGWLLTMLGVIVSWVFFRAANLAEGGAILKAMLGLNGLVIPSSPQGKLAFLQNFGLQLQSWDEFRYLQEALGSKFLGFVCLFALILAVKFLPNTQEIIARFQPKWYWALPLGLLTSFSLLSLSRVSEFLYFQF
jgi:alginate O-acetyltransferase complex protein AlgI